MDGRTDGQTVLKTDARTESIIANTALCTASYADALEKRPLGLQERNAFRRTGKLRVIYLRQGVI